MQVSSKRQIPAGTALRYLVSLGLMAWLCLKVDWSGLASLQGINWTLLLAAVFLAGVAYPLQAWRWQILLAGVDLQLPARWVHALSWTGQFYNSFLPGGVAGDAVRCHQLWQVRPDQKAAGAASILADRLLGFGTLLAMACAALGFHLSQATGHRHLELLFGISLASLGLLLGGAWSLGRTRWWDALGVRLIGPERAAALHEAARHLGDRPVVLTRATLLSFGIWGADFLALWLLAGSVGLDTGLLSMTVAAAVAYTAAALPISIGGHGVREGTLVVVLGLLDIGRDQPDHVAQLTLLFWSLSIAWSAVGGPLGWLLRSRNVPAERTRNT